MERVLGSMLENAWQMANADLVQSATTISHMLSGNGAISDTLLIKGARGSKTPQHRDRRPAFCGVSFELTNHEDTRHREKDSLLWAAFACINVSQYCCKRY